MKNNKYYEKNKEAIKEAAKAWYYKHKEEIVARNKAKRDAIKEAKEAEKAERQKRGEDTRKRYYYNPEKLALRKSRKSMDVQCPAYITCTAYPNGMILIDALVSPSEFRSMSETDKEATKNKIHLDRILHEINPCKRIIVIEDNEIQVYVPNVEKLQETVDAIASFVEDFEIN